MKKTLFVVILAIALSSCTQVRFLHIIYGNEHNWNIIPKQSVPTEVINAFKDKYPENVTVTQWMKPGKNKYAVSFINNGKVTLAVFSGTGLLQDEENYDQEDYYQEEEYDNYWESDMFD